MFLCPLICFSQGMGGGFGAEDDDINIGGDIFNDFNEDLEAISLSEVKNGRPPLSAMVVYKSGSSSKSMLEAFYEMCETLYNLSPETTKPNAKFLRSLQANCHEYWKIAENYKQFGPKKW